MILEVEKLTVVYQGQAIGLKDMDLSMDAGEVVAVLGLNGAGKTSLLRGIAGFVGRDGGRVAHGTVKFDGRPIHNLPPYRIARLGIALVPERDKVFAELTVLEQLSLAAGIVGRQRYLAALEHVLELFPNLKLHLKRPAGYLSGGERQMLAIAAALCAGSRLLLIDELSQGLAPGLIKAVVEQIRRINAEGITVLLVEQNPRVAASLASRMFMLDGGRIVASGPTDELMRDPALVRAYLGVAAANQ